MDLTAFRTRYPEFSFITDDTFVQAILDEADLELASTDDWGTRRDTAQGLLAADKLWNSPAGATLRMSDTKDDENAPSSRYANALRRLSAKTFPAVIRT